MIGVENLEKLADADEWKDHYTEINGFQILSRSTDRKTYSK